MRQFGFLSEYDAWRDSRRNRKIRRLLLGQDGLLLHRSGLLYGREAGLLRSRSEMLRRERRLLLGSGGLLPERGRVLRRGQGLLRPSGAKESGKLLRRLLRRRESLGFACP